MGRKPKPNLTNNTVHFVCFDCRKAFKQPGSSNWNADIAKRPFACPNCKRPMTPLGRYFKAQSQRAAKQWLKVELLLRFGEDFWSGHKSLGTRCDTLASTIRYLVDSGNEESGVRQNLEQIRRQRQGP